MILNFHGEIWKGMNFIDIYSYSKKKDINRLDLGTDVLYHLWVWPLGDLDLGELGLRLFYANISDIDHGGVDGCTG